MSIEFENTPVNSVNQSDLTRNELLESILVWLQVEFAKTAAEKEYVAPIVAHIESLMKF